MQVHFAKQLDFLGNNARHYGDYLQELSFVIFITFILSVCGRAIFIRACFLGFKSRTSPGREALKVPLPSIASYIYASLLIEVLFFALAPVYIFMPFFIILLQ